MQLPLDPSTVKGFLDPQEGARLYELAAQASQHGPCLEIGSYCGKSTLYVGAGAKSAGGQVFALDHHRGSEEHQLGEEYHDKELFDAQAQQMDSLPYFRSVLLRSGLEDTVVPLIGKSGQVGRYWTTPLSLVFIDGGHSLAAAMTDYRTWAPHILVGGHLAIHDLFPDPSEGGQPPYDIYKLALASGLFSECEMTKTLGVLQRV